MAAGAVGSLFRRGGLRRGPRRDLYRSRRASRGLRKRTAEDRKRPRRPASAEVNATDDPTNTGSARRLSFCSRSSSGKPRRRRDDQPMGRPRHPSPHAAERVVRSYEARFQILAKTDIRHRLYAAVLRRAGVMRHTSKFGDHALGPHAKERPIRSSPTAFVRPQRPRRSTSSRRTTCEPRSAGRKFIFLSSDGGV